MEQVFEGQAVADPGTPGRRRVYWVLAIILIALVTGMQQLSVLAHGAKPVPTVEPVEKDPLKQAQAAKPLGDEMDGPDMAGRLVVKLYQAMPKGPGSGPEQFAQLVDPAQQVDFGNAVKLVPAYTELAGKKQGLKAIEELRGRLAKGTGPAGRAELEKDLDNLDDLYTNGSAAIDEPTRVRITNRLGWQGRLALTFDKPEGDAGREAMLANGTALIVLVMVIAVGVLGVLVGGAVMFVWALVLVSTGKLNRRLDKPALGGSLGVEVLVVFLTGFLGLKIALSVLAAMAEAGWLGTGMKESGEGALTVIALFAQWLILPMVVLYPHLRGYSQGRYKRAMGWHRGEGFGREVLAGIAGYLACVPLYLVAVVVSLVLSLIEHAITKQITGEEPSGPVNPIGEMISQSWWVAALVIVLATVWAPIVEESVFRGGLFRQLNARMAIGWAALLSGTVFAMMHGYSPSLFPPLIALGAGFALIRAWRGSLVACVTAHALHNGTLTIVMLLLFSLLK